MILLHPSKADLLQSVFIHASIFWALHSNEEFTNEHFFQTFVSIAVALFFIVCLSNTISIVVFYDFLKIIFFNLKILICSFYKSNLFFFENKFLFTENCSKKKKRMLSVWVPQETHTALTLCSQSDLFFII